MKLYHGTSLQFLPDILREGLKPRRLRDGNWKHTVKSNSKLVYLTNAYAPYFCFQAMKDLSEGALVIEVETDLIFPGGRLVPDEDALEQGAEGIGANPPGDKEERTKYWRKRQAEFMGTHVWLNSLALLGTCGCFGVIAPSSITRLVHITGEENLVALALCFDPCIVVANFAIMGATYRAKTNRLFGYDPDPEIVDLLFKGPFKDRWKIPVEADLYVMKAGKPELERHISLPDERPTMDEFMEELGGTQDTKQVEEAGNNKEKGSEEPS